LIIFAKKYVLQSSATGLRVTQKDKYLCSKNKKTTARAGDNPAPSMYLILGVIADMYQQVELK
jgi:hypothetical protein